MDSIVGPLADPFLCAFDNIVGIMEESVWVVYSCVGQEGVEEKGGGGGPAEEEGADDQGAEADSNRSWPTNRMVS